MARIRLWKVPRWQPWTLPGSEKRVRAGCCGSVDLQSFNGYVNSYIAIHTVVSTNNGLSLWTSSGLMADSKADQEEQGYMDKADFHCGQ